MPYEMHYCHSTQVTEEMHLFYQLLWFSFFISKCLQEDFPHLVFASVDVMKKSKI